jgi:hypothetical protein
MKAPFLAAVALVAVALAGVSQAGPTSKLYLTSGYGSGNITVVQGNTITSFPEAYGSPHEIPIAVYGDVRTTADNPWYSNQGGQYTLGGTPTGTIYALSGNFCCGAEDSTTDGNHNYLVSNMTGRVYQTGRDYTNATSLFSLGVPGYLGITYDSANNSLWISGFYSTVVADYSLNGTLLSSFSTGHVENAALAMDPADHTLWLVHDDVNGYVGWLEQYSTAGVLLSTGPNVGYTFGGEFNLAPATPEPGTLILFGSGILGLAGVLRRRINL